MLAILNISNFALIDRLQIEFDSGLNLLTGETGSGKSILVDALSTLIGGRMTSDLLKAGESQGHIEGLFLVKGNARLQSLLDSGGIQTADGAALEILIRREFSASGRNKTLINHQLATQSMLRELRPFLIDIHGQGDQQTLFDPDAHLEILDSYAGLTDVRFEAGARYAQLTRIDRELSRMRQGEAEKLQLIDTLRFQIDELERATLERGEDRTLEEERRRLTSVEKLTGLCSEALEFSYDDSASALSRIVHVTRRIEELTDYQPEFGGYIEGLESSRALLEDLAFALRDFAGKLEFSPDRLAGVEARLDELSRLKRKYGGTVESALDHLARSRERLQALERSDEQHGELLEQSTEARTAFFEIARRLHQERVKSAKRLERGVSRELAEVAMKDAGFEVRIQTPENNTAQPDECSARGCDRVEFFFSANVGEPLKPLAKIASGGEASRLMLVLKTIASGSDFPRTIVFDEIDSGIGGRVSEAVGMKLKSLSERNQVLCVTHQAQIARFADSHLRVSKDVVRGRTRVSIEKLDRRARVEEIARMLTGTEITDTARRHAREMLKIG